MISFPAMQGQRWEGGKAHREPEVRCGVRTGTSLGARDTWREADALVMGTDLLGRESEGFRPGGQWPGGPAGGVQAGQEHKAGPRCGGYPCCEALQPPCHLWATVAFCCLRLDSRKLWVPALLGPLCLQPVRPWVRTGGGLGASAAPSPGPSLPVVWVSWGLQF